MSAPRFVKGDRVGTADRYGNNLVKRRFGRVADVGAKGVLIDFDSGESHWKPSGTVLFESDGELVRDRPAAVKIPAAPPDRPVGRAPEATRPATLPETAPRAPSSASPRDVLAEMVGNGVDLFRLWGAIGEALLSSAGETLAAAESRRQAAEREVADAETLLAEARARLAEAERELQSARDARQATAARLGTA